MFAHTSPTPAPHSAGNRSSGALSEQAVAALTLNTDPYLSCDDCFEQVDEMVEAVIMHSGHLTEAFRVHLQGCPACHEEALTLAELAAAEMQLDSEWALEAMTREVASSSV